MSGKLSNESNENITHMSGIHTLEQAVEYAKQKGGWIALWYDGTVSWYDAQYWTLTTVMLDRSCSAKIGGWDYFEQGDHLVI